MLVESQGRISIEANRKKKLGENLSQCHFVYHISHTDQVANPGLRDGRPATNQETKLVLLPFTYSNYLSGFEQVSTLCDNTLFSATNHQDVAVRTKSRPTSVLKRPAPPYLVRFSTGQNLRKNGNDKDNGTATENSMYFSLKGRATYTHHTVPRNSFILLHWLHLTKRAAAQRWTHPVCPACVRATIQTLATLVG
jgi:hypothetical protein